MISAPALSWLGHSLHGTTARYLLALSLVSLITLGVWAFTVGPLGNDLIAIRDDETAAQIIGVPVLKTKLVAFALSSAIIGVAGFLWAFT